MAKNVILRMIEAESHEWVNKNGHLMYQTSAVNERETEHEIFKVEFRTYEIPPVPRGCAWCPTCGEWLPKSRFYPNKSRPNGLANYCSKHDNQQRTLRRRQARERERLQQAS